MKTIGTMLGKALAARYDRATFEPCPDRLAKLVTRLDLDYFRDKHRRSEFVRRCRGSVSLGSAVK
jgi:hypothetical protein